MDPHRAREARIYARPIPSREYLLEVLRSCSSPASFEQLCVELGLDEDLDGNALRRRLLAMQRDGQVICNRRDEYGLAERMDMVRGRVHAHRDGYGFLVLDDVDPGERDDLFLSPREMRALMHGDRVVARVAHIDRRGRREVAVVEILERGTHSVVGRLFTESGVAFVSPDSKRIHHDVLIPSKAAGGASNGQIVVAEITEQPSKRSQPVGRIVEVLGEHMAPGMDVDIAIRTHELPSRWPEAVVREASQLGPDTLESALSSRLDARQLPLVTIDGVDARDFDDAVYCERRARGWRLYVAIADVSSYVLPGSALDEEARLRGTSVYFPDRVIPMLPEALSNGLCSLKPDEDRLCLLCEMSVSDAGHVSHTKFREAVMRSHARLTYDQMAAVAIDKKADARRRFAEIAPHLDDLYDLYKALRAERERRGAIDFDTIETRIVFSEERRVERIVPLLRNDAHRIIEECMVSANVAAARYLSKKKMPLFYRVHERPQADKLADLNAFLSELGLQLGSGKTTEPGDYAAIVAQVTDLPESHLIQMLLLRSLAQAVYSPKNIGHFGLALDCYAHFTSPIRRYPDLLVHRAIRHALSGQAPGDFDSTNASMEHLGEHCSATERRADDATRDATGWLKCEYMLDKVGKEFDGLISAVTSFGLFVQLEQIFVEGLVHVSAIGNDYYHFDPKRHCLEGERTGVSFRIADKVRVCVSRVNLDERKVDLELVSGRGRARGRLGRARRRPASTGGRLGRRRRGG